MITKVISLLVYEDIDAAHDFLVKAFGFTPGYLHKDEAGRTVHGELSAGDHEIWLHRVAAEHDLASPRDLPAASSGLVVQVADVDAHYEHARANGAHIDKPPQDQFYGQRDYGARDPEGHRWWFATPIK